MVCAWGSRLRHGGLTQFRIIFLRYRTTGPEVIFDQKKSSRNGSGSHVPSETSRHRPPTALKTLQRGNHSSVDHTLFKFSRDLCPVRRGIAAAVRCSVRKARFSCAGSNQRLPISTDGTARGFQYDERKSCFVFCFLER